MVSGSGDSSSRRREFSEAKASLDAVVLNENSGLMKESLYYMRA